MFWRVWGKDKNGVVGGGSGERNSRRFESCSVNNQLHQQRELGRCSVELRWKELLVPTTLVLFQLNFRFYQQTVLWLRKYFCARKFLGFGGRGFRLLDFSIRMLIITCTLIKIHKLMHFKRIKTCFQQRTILYIQTNAQSIHLK